ncbi:MAG TPA: hypothetical protein VF202_02175, partial [Trueperaceae bacterium]
ANGNVVCMVEGGPLRREVTIANARLIAAAPRLAEALERVKEWNAEMHRVNDPSLIPCFTSDLYNDWRELMIEVRAALREAGLS